MDKGIDLVYKLQEIELSEEYLEWMLSRPPSKNSTFQLNGLIIAGYLSNNIIGKALGRGRNVIMISDFKKRAYRFPPLVEIPEICFKNDIYILRWKTRWVLQTSSGNQILARIFQANSYYNISVKGKNQLPVFSFSDGQNIKTILHRISEKYGSKYLQGSDKITKATLIFKWSPDRFNALMDMDNKTEVLVLTTHLNQDFTEPLKQTGYKLIWIDTKSLLDEISREIYYIIKRKNSLDIDYLIQNPMITE